MSEMRREQQQPPPPPRATPQPQSVKAKAAGVVQKAQAAAGAQANSVTLRQNLLTRVDQELKQSGYLPPTPPPLLRGRTLRDAADYLRTAGSGADLLAVLAGEVVHARAAAPESYAFVDALQKSVKRTAFSPFTAIVRGVHPVIYQAKVSVEIPKSSATLRDRMLRTEKFLASEWAGEADRGVLSVHADEDAGTTIVQMGVARHGTVYITIPRVLRPNDVAVRSIRALFEHVTPFGSVTDPMAIVDGSYQEINFSEVFKSGRVLRATSGDTARFAANLSSTLSRGRLAPENTAIVNSAPRNANQYRSVFSDDPRATKWPLWSEEPPQWDDIVGGAGFASTAEASGQTLLSALTESKNVIIVVAHCDGTTLFMPEPEPNGTQVTADYLRENRAAISENAPFVYLFSCKAADIENQRNFASTLLECGASGVVASQSLVGSEEARTMLSRILSAERRAPPIDDFLRAMKEYNYFDMEVFLA